MTKTKKSFYEEEFEVMNKMMGEEEEIQNQIQTIEQKLELQVRKFTV